MNEIRIPAASVEDAILAADPAHTAADHDRVLDLMADAGAASAYTVPSETYTAFVNAAGKVVAYLNHGYVTVLAHADRVPAEYDRVSVSTAAAGIGVDVYLSTWIAPRPKANEVRMNHPKVGRAPEINYCLEDGCTAWLPPTEAFCRRHAVAYA